MAPHTITIDKAYELDLEWENANQPPDKLRCVTYRRCGGNLTRTLLTVPGDDSAPCYQAVNGHFQHISGPTLDEWQFEQACREQQEAIERAGGMSAYHDAAHDAAELEGVLQAEYRDEADTRRSLRFAAVQ